VNGMAIGRPQPRRRRPWITAAWISLAAIGLMLLWTQAAAVEGSTAPNETWVRPTMVALGLFSLIIVVVLALAVPFLRSGGPRMRHRPRRRSDRI